MAGRRTTTPLTDSERRAREERTTARLRELHDQLADQVRAVSSGADWQRFLALAGHFHNDSASNVWLIMAQRPNATLVAGYDAWQQAGRQVRKGERSITVVAPVVRTDDTGRTVAGVIADRAPTHLFDISQTDGPAVPQQPPVRMLAGTVRSDLWDNLAAPALRRGWSIERGAVADADGNGWTSPAEKRIVVRADLDDRQAVKTLAHELGHVLLRHGTGHHRGFAEIEAESVAYVVLAAHGVDTSDFTLPYVAGWGYASNQPPEDVVRATAERVVTAAHTILDAAPPPAGLAAELVDRTALARLAARSAEARQATAAIADRAQLRAAQAKRPTPRLAVAESPPPAAGRETHVRDSDTPQPQLLEPAWRLDRLEAANRDASDYFATALSRSSTTRNYLAERLGADGGRAVGGWTLGYAPASWTGAVDHLRRAGHTDERIVESGIGVVAKNGRLVDRFRDRVMIGVHDDAGRLCGFVGRDMSGADAQRRYLNTPANPLFAKAELLIGLHEQRDQWPGAAAVLVEGPFDALAIAATPGNRGRLAAVAPSGTAVTPAQLALLDRTLPAGRELVLALDADPAGRAAALRTAELAMHMDRPVFVTRLPDGQDPAAYAHDVGAASLAAYLGEPRRRPALDVLVDARIERHAERLQWVEGQVDAARDVAALLATVPATSTVDVTLHAAEMIGVSPMLLHDEIGAVRDRAGAASERLAERAADLTLRPEPGDTSEPGPRSPAQLAALGSATPVGPASRPGRAARERPRHAAAGLQQHSGRLER